MNRNYASRFRRVALAVLLVLPAGTPFATPKSVESSPSFEPVQAVHMADPVYPYASVGTGVVLLKVDVDAHGPISGIEVIRPIASLTEPSEEAARESKFSPARLNGKAVPSSIIVAFGFCTANSGNLPWTGNPRTKTTSSFEPINILAISDANFPTAAATSSSVALSVTIGESGDIKHIDAIHAVPPFTERAEQAVRKWRFEAAKLKGKPVTSTLVVSYTFRVQTVFNGRY